MTILNKCFEPVAKADTQEPISVLVSDIYGTLIGDKQEYVQELLLWAESNNVKVILASTEPDKANRALQKENIDPSLQEKTVQDKGQLYDQLFDDGIPFAVVDDDIMLAALSGASLLLNIQHRAVQQFLTEEKYKDAPKPGGPF